MDSSTLQIAIGLRLDVPICVPHDCICGATVDCLGTHGLSCRKSAGRSSWHSLANDVIKWAFRAADWSMSSLSHDDGKRPGGLSLMLWKAGRCLVWDFTCPDTFAASHFNCAVTDTSCCYRDWSKEEAQVESVVCHIQINTGSDSLLVHLEKTLLIFCRNLAAALLLLLVNRVQQSFCYKDDVDVQWGNAACILDSDDF